MITNDPIRLLVATACFLLAFALVCWGLRQVRWPQVQVARPQAAAAEQSDGLAVWERGCAEIKWNKEDNIDHK